MPPQDAATLSQDLRTGIPLWTRTPHSTVAAEHRLPRRRFDVIVVGAGISGALTAEALTRAGKSVLIVDRRPPVRGSTPASTAMILHEIDVPLTHLSRKIGAAKAEAAWRRSVRSVDTLIDLTERLGIDCGIERKPTLYLAGDDMGARALKHEAEARMKIGIDADYLTRSAVADRFGLDRPAAILSRVSASANPAQLAAGLLKASLARKARLVSPIEISDMAELPGGVALATRDSAVLTAEHVVFCTGYEHLPEMETAAHSVVSTWALASKPLKGLPAWLRETLVWEASDPYLYFRADAAGRIIVGGEDEASAESSSDPARIAGKARTIADKFKALTGIALGKPAYAWGAPFGVTRDGLPIIDRVPGHERIFTVMGFGGNGITFSMIGAEIIAAAIAGRTDPDAALFAYR